MSTEKLYGWSDSEQLLSDPDQVVWDYIDNTKCDKTWHEWAMHQQWPKRVSVFRRMDPKKHADKLAASVLEDLLERLDEEYSDPDGDYTKPTERMKVVARVFVDAVLNDYQAWACEPTGEVVEITWEDAWRVWKTGGVK